MRTGTDSAILALGDATSRLFKENADLMRERGWTGFALENEARTFAAAYVEATGKPCVMHHGCGGRYTVHHEKG